MFFFSRKHSVLESGILEGKTDVHCHLLPGVDDGSPDVEHSLALLAFMEELGYSEIWFTPHVMQDLHNTAEKLKGEYQAFLPLYKGKLKTNLASEYMMDAGFGERLSTDPMRLGRHHLLVETSYMYPPTGMHDILLSVWNAGFRPLIAHPERYMYMEKGDYEDLKGLGYDFQMNLMSLSGYYGLRPKMVAEELLKEGFYDFVGSDLHHLERYQPMLERMKLPTKQLDALERLLSNNSSEL